MTDAKLRCIDSRLRSGCHFLRRFGRPLEPDFPCGDQDDETVVVPLDVELRPHRDDASAIHTHHEGSHGIFRDLEVSIPVNQVDAALVCRDGHLNAASGIERDVRAVLEWYGAYLSDLRAITAALAGNVPGGQADCREDHQGHGRDGGFPNSMKPSARSDCHGAKRLERKRTPHPSPPVWYRTGCAIHGQ